MFCLLENVQKTKNVLDFVTVIAQVFCLEIVSKYLPGKIHFFNLFKFMFLNTEFAISNEFNSFLIVNCNSALLDNALNISLLRYASYVSDST